MKKLIILIAAAVILIGGAYFLYNNLSESNRADQLATQPQSTEGSTPTEDTEPTQDTEPTHNIDSTQNTEVQGGEITAPNFTVYDADGNSVQLHDFVGKPIVLNFWASWCYPCQSEMPGFQEVFNEMGQEVTFLMVNAGDETVEEVAPFLEQTGYTFPVFYDLTDSAAYAYYVTSFPTTYFLNAQGDVVTYAIGALNKEILLEGISYIYSQT